jgi:hypothetical protein
MSKSRASAVRPLRDAGDRRARQRRYAGPGAAGRSSGWATIALNVSIVKGRASTCRHTPGFGLERALRVVGDEQAHGRVVGAGAERQVQAVELAQADVGDEQRQVRNREQAPPRLVERRDGFDRVAELPQRVRDRSQLDGIRFDDQRGRRIS